VNNDTSLFTSHPDLVELDAAPTVPDELITLSTVPEHLRPTDTDRADARQELAGQSSAMQAATAAGVAYAALVLLASGVPGAESCVRQALAKGAIALGVDL
jgi:hypothetical protein